MRQRARRAQRRQTGLRRRSWTWPVLSLVCSAALIFLLMELFTGRLDKWIWSKARNWGLVQEESDPVGTAPQAADPGHGAEEGLKTEGSEAAPDPGLTPEAPSSEVQFIRSRLDIDPQRMEEMFQELNRLSRGNASPDGREKLSEPYAPKGIPLVTKRHWVDGNYAPGALAPELLEAFKRMQGAAAKEGIDLEIISGYRSYELQKSVFAEWTHLDGLEETEGLSARKGQSEHQTGLAIDINELGESFADTEAGRWLAQHAWEYGFILRFPKGQEGITGYTFEPWHYRYVGLEHSKYFGPNSSLTLEEYLGDIGPEGWRELQD